MRIVALKPRQAGFSTITASRFSHRMFTDYHYTGLMMADKKARTDTVAGIYKTFLNELDGDIKPMIAKNNTEEVLLDNPDEKLRKVNPGLGSGIIFETGNDPNAGRSGTRRFAHLTEHAFYRYAKEIDDGVQNSIPLADDTAIIKESTANGRAGTGKSFYDLWQAAKRGESIYKPFFVAWYEVDDYFITPPDNWKATKKELDILKKHPTVTEANLMWRRLKIQEYLNDDEDTILTPEERFCQDFPLDDEEAFLSTGAPVFDNEKVNALIRKLRENKPIEIQHRFEIKSRIVKQFFDGLKIYAPPRENRQYYIGADVSEGLAIGDASSAFIMDHEYRQVARWHGKIDPDMFGHLLIAIGEIYNNALIIPESNAMGHTTVTTIRNQGYPMLYKELVEDESEGKRVVKYGWRTTVKSKMDMLNEAVKFIRDGECQILDVKLPEEMALVAREENGKVVLNGRDRVVAFALALMGRKHYNFSERTIPKRINSVTGTGEEERIAWERKHKKSKADMFD